MNNQLKNLSPEEVSKIFIREFAKIGKDKKALFFIESECDKQSIFNSLSFKPIKDIADVCDAFNALAIGVADIFMKGLLEKLNSEPLYPELEEEKE